jgi:hypothetical protein
MPERTAKSQSFEKQKTAKRIPIRMTVLMSRDLKARFLAEPGEVCSGAFPAVESGESSESESVSSGITLV